jgi:hypothetical protein
MGLFGIPLNFRDLLTLANNLSQDQKDVINKSDDEYIRADMNSLYGTTLLMLINVFLLLFLINDKVDRDKIILIECLFLSGFGLIMLVIRVWNIKFYILEPVLNTWINTRQQEVSKKTFFFTVFFCLIGIILMIVGAILVVSSNFVISILLTAITYVTFILSALSYRCHAGSYMLKVIEYQNNQYKPV